MQHVTMPLSSVQPKQET